MPFGMPGMPGAGMPGFDMAALQQFMQVGEWGLDCVHSGCFERTEALRALPCSLLQIGAF